MALAAWRCSSTVTERFAFVSVELGRMGALAGSAHTAGRLVAPPRLEARGQLGGVPAGPRQPRVRPFGTVHHVASRIVSRRRL
eukprot:CAMPEP_0113932806 /NCGR_PEP_ID=MMETSP1159-20121227/7316_1 /TAXON_ID=88271 /ORGANISM="Picocystis salinarum" /LENGTH=82 /DNA_ID=CAMNT_0000933953 /DNA_START=343 /DNA_END=591 /DNA_ORIENTATION=- /assembly_acc=CAM_ASM_000767